MTQGIQEGGRAALPNPLPTESGLQPDGVRLTVYDQGASLVRDRRTLKLKTGLNDIELTEIAAKIDPTSVNFISLSNPGEALIVEHNYRHDVSGRDTLLIRYLHEKVEVTLEDGTRYTGELCSGRETASGPRPPFASPNDDIIVRQSDGQLVAIRQSRIRDIRFPEIEQRLYTQPTLRCLIDSSLAGTQQIELTYQTQGLTWSAYYNLLLAANGRQFDLNGWVALQNQSGITFQEAQVALVQVSERRQVPPQTDDQPATNPFRRPSLPPMQPRFGETRFEQTEARDLPRLHHFALRRPVSIAHGETRQVEFLTAHAVSAQNYFVYDASMRFDSYPQFPLKKQNDGQTHVVELQSMLEFNVMALGSDLPAGLLRVYQESGALLTTTEARIEHMPENEKVRLSLGRAPELIGKRTQKEFRPLSRVLLEETYEIRLRNRRADRGVRIHVPERLFRWNDWEILSASHEYTQLDSTTIEFRVDVPALGETVINYIVRYIWPS
ncbi:MAG: hypothetical protein U0694_20535 [Anaerolineae bacterium]